MPITPTDRSAPPPPASSAAGDAARGAGHAGHVVTELLHAWGAGDAASVPDLTSTGRLYHHLRALSAARVVEQESRNRYRIAPEKVVPLLVLTVAAADVGEQLR